MGVKRSKQASQTLVRVLLGKATRKLAGRPLQRVRGYFNYYFVFADQFHSVINRFLKRAEKHPFIKLLLDLAMKDYVRFRPPDPKVYETVYTDA